MISSFDILCGEPPNRARPNNKEKAMKRKNATCYHIESSALSDKDKAIAKVLLSNKKDILRKLAEACIREDETSEYTYNVPTGLYFDIGDLAGGYQIHSLPAVVIMARASSANACYLDCDKEGFPELPQFCGGKEGFHRVKITDPFAWQIDDAIRDYQEGMGLNGTAKIVNGKFYKVA